MDNIDLTLRKEFSPKLTGRGLFDDTAKYNRSMDFRDQRRAKLDILGFDSFVKDMFGFVFEDKSYKEFFGLSNRNRDKLSFDEDILRITGIITKDLQLEYDSGFGNESVCDCCGRYRSQILNSEKYGICDNCEKSSKFRNENFWNRKDHLREDQWID